MGACYGDRVTEPHQLAEHLGALYNRHASRQCRLHFRVLSDAPRSTRRPHRLYRRSQPRGRARSAHRAGARRSVTALGFRSRALHVVAEIDAALRRCRPCRCRRCRRSGCAGCGACDCRWCADAEASWRLPGEIEYSTGQRFCGVRRLASRARRAMSRQLQAIASLDERAPQQRTRARSPGRKSRRRRPPR